MTIDRVELKLFDLEHRCKKPLTPRMKNVKKNTFFIKKRKKR